MKGGNAEPAALCVHSYGVDRRRAGVREIGDMAALDA